MTLSLLLFFFFKQKTAYELRISDWSSDVCSSDLPTGTISLSLANNASNGIEPSFAHHYSRNVIREGKKSKEKVDVFSFELLAYRELVNQKAMPFSEDAASKLPDYFISADDITPTEHVDVQAAAQKWVDSSISTTANVPTDYPSADFKDIYRYAHESSEQSRVGKEGVSTDRHRRWRIQKKK